MAVLLILARVSSLLVTALVLVWAFGFRASFLHHPSSTAAAANLSDTTHLDHLYSALHPLLMVIGFIILSGEAILVHRWMTGLSRGVRKAVHLWLQGAALGFGLFGIWAKFKGRDGILANFYSLHSWMGLLCVILFTGQGLLKMARAQQREVPRGGAGASSSGPVEPREVIRRAEVAEARAGAAEARAEAAESEAVVLRDELAEAARESESQKQRISFLERKVARLEPGAAVPEPSIG